MNLQLSPNNWSCLATSFAMILGLPVSKVIEMVGHDGSEIVFPDQPEPSCRRSFHIQELIDVCMSMLVTVTEIQRVPCMGPRNDEEFLVLEDDDRFFRYVRAHSGVLCGLTREGGYHAVAWDGEKIYDPKGFICDLSEFNPSVFYAVRY